MLKPLLIADINHFSIISSYPIFMGLGIWEVRFCMSGPRCFALTLKKAASRKRRFVWLSHSSGKIQWDNGKCWNPCWRLISIIFRLSHLIPFFVRLGFWKPRFGKFSMVLYFNLAKRMVWLSHCLKKSHGIMVNAETLAGGWYKLISDYLIISHYIPLSYHCGSDLTYLALISHPYPIIPHYPVRLALFKNFDSFIV